MGWKVKESIALSCWVIASLNLSWTSSTVYMMFCDFMQFSVMGGIKIYWKVQESNKYWNLSESSKEDLCLEQLGFSDWAIEDLCRQALDWG